MEANVDALLKQAVNHGASDIHLKVGSAPIVRIDGELRRLEGYGPLGPAETKAYADAMFTENAAAELRGDRSHRLRLRETGAGQVPGHRLQTARLGLIGVAPGRARVEVLLRAWGSPRRWSASPHPSRGWSS